MQIVSYDFGKSSLAEIRINLSVDLLDESMEVLRTPIETSVPADESTNSTRV
jgi:hypothetical protein